MQICLHLQYFILNLKGDHERTRTFVYSNMKFTNKQANLFSNVRMIKELLLLIL